MTNRLEFIIPGDPAKDLGGNVIRRLHWAEWGRRVARWQRVAHLCWCQSGGVQFSRPVRITYTFRRGRKIDQENLPTKALTDGLKGPQGMIPDDSPQWLTEVVARQDAGATWRDQPEVFVVVEESE